MADEERCCVCDSRTGRAGRQYDSLYVGENGPFCEDCHIVIHGVVAMGMFVGEPEIGCLRALLRRLTKAPDPRVCTAAGTKAIRKLCQSMREARKDAGIVAKTASLDERDRVPFTKDAVRDYLDVAIRGWRSDIKSTPGGNEVAAYYLEAFQSARFMLFGEWLP